MLLQFVVAPLFCIAISTFAVATAQEIKVTIKLLEKIVQIKIGTKAKQERLNGLRQLCAILKCPDGKEEEWEKHLKFALIKIHPDKVKPDMRGLATDAAKGKRETNNWALTALINAKKL
ncbi:hypothetical protein niasHT_017333 [Heterodera trifolii]|uniref:J domain-containing protein n=1 Tax=Heterodera trifolii TaxID=157864 RepID=A0ABD2KHW8_9BILA